MIERVIDRKLYLDLAADGAANFISIGKQMQFNNKIVATNLVCTDADGYIGVRGVLGLPWRCPDDMAIFKKLTMGKTLVMGAETWATIPNGLPGRTVVIINRIKNGCQNPANPNVCHFKPENFGDIEELKDFIGEDFFICGGGLIYEAYGVKADMEIVNTLSFRLDNHVENKSSLISYKPLRGYDNVMDSLPCDGEATVYQGQLSDHVTQQPVGNHPIQTVITGAGLDLHKDLAPVEEPVEYTNNPHQIRLSQLGPMFMCDMSLRFRSAN